MFVVAPTNLNLGLAIDDQCRAQADGRTAQDQPLEVDATGVLQELVELAERQARDPRDLVR